MKNCTPLRLVADNSEYRGRLGGLAPDGVTPRFCDAETSYFATVPMSETCDASIFLSTSDTNLDRSVWTLAHRIHDQGCEFIEAVVHRPARRSKKSRYWELVSPVSLCPLPERSDMDPYWEGCRYMSHKIGGQPGLIPGNQHWDEPLQRLLDDDFRLLLQIAFPSSADARIEGSWPFGEMLFFLFCRDRDQGHEFKFLWTR